MNTASLSCYKCQTPLEVYQIGFRTVCDKCLAGQHCCLNCRNHAPGRRNECLIPDTDYITDRAANNFCDDFQVKNENGPPPPSREDAINRARRLLGD
jgi:hypothetical protein